MHKMICSIFFIVSFFSHTLKATGGDTDIDSILVVTHQQSSVTTPRSETLYSIDLELTHQRDGWGFFTWFEHAKSQNVNSVSSTFGDVNSDSGTVSHGNAQISAFYIYGGASIDSTDWLFGLNEVSTLIDNSDFANDEVNQFLSAGLVNNKSINFPDYSLSARMQNLTKWDQFGYRIVFASSYGLAENNGNYHQLLTLNSTQNGDTKGIFHAAELTYQTSNIQGNFGIWQNTGVIAEQEHKTGSSKGIYVGLDLSINQINYNFRYGYSDVNDTAQLESINFIGASLQKPFYNGELGSGFSLTRFSSNDFLGRNMEIYYRFNLQKNCHLTTAFQWTNEVDNTAIDRIYFLPTIRLEVVL